MSGTKKYKREEVLDQAIELFRKQGFEATSTAHLSEALGINRKSMYAEFGSKQGLFEACLDRYSKLHLTRVLAPIEAPDADAVSIEKAFETYASAIDTKFRGLGCLMCNTAVERAAHDEASGTYVDAYLTRLKGIFQNALSNAKEKRQISADIDLTETADFLTLTFVGISALIRANAAPAMVKAAARTATQTLTKMS